MVQTLSIAGGLKLDLEITRYDPPRGAESRFETNGIKLITGYELEPNGGGTRLTQTLDAKAGGITARMLIPVVQGRLEKKVTADLDRLKSRAGGLMLARARSRCSRSPRRRAAQVSTAADALRTDHVYVDPQAEQAGAVDAAALRSEIGDKPIYIAVLPESAVEGSPGRTLIALRQDVGEEGRYALVVGDELRTLPADAAPDAGDLQAALTEFAAGRARRRPAAAARSPASVRDRAADRGRRRRRVPARQPPPQARRRRQVGRRARRTSTRTSCGSATGSGRSSST